MNTKIKPDQKKNQRRKTRPEHEPKKQGRNPNMIHDDQKPHEHEHPEMRMTR